MTPFAIGLDDGALPGVLLTRLFPFKLQNGLALGGALARITGSVPSLWADTLDSLVLDPPPSSLGTQGAPPTVPGLVAG